MAFKTLEQYLYCRVFHFSNEILVGGTAAALTFLHLQHVNQQPVVSTFQRACSQQR